MTTKRNRVAIYVATFTKRNNLKNSIEHQIQRCKERALDPRFGFELIEVYIDEAVSGEDLQRPALQRLFADVRDGSIDWVFVTDFKKYSPKKEIYYAITDELRSYGAGTLTASEPKKPKPPALTFEVREFKFSAETLSLFAVFSGEKTQEEHESEFGTLSRYASVSDDDSDKPES